MANKRVLVFLIGILLAFPAQAAQVPRNEKAIPIYPGAVRDSLAEAEAIAEEERFLSEAGFEYQQGDDVLMPRAFAIHVYKVAAPAEKVLQFYLDNLGGTEEDGSEYLYDETMAAGAVSAVYYQVSFVDFSVYTRDDARMEKARIKKVRAPFKPDQWISGADFSWKVGEKNADVSIFDLMIRDDYFYTFDGNGNRKVQTSITVQKKTYMNPDDALGARQDARREQERQEAFEHDSRVREVAGKAFVPEDLGISLYPGARYDADTTQFLKKSMAVNCLAYQSNDDVLAVARYYEEQSGFKRVYADEKGALLKRCGEEYNAFLKRMMSTGECDAEITIQNPWKEMETGRLMKTTLISIVNRAE